MRKLVLQKIEKLTWDESKGVHNFIFKDKSKLVSIISSPEDPSPRVIILDADNKTKKIYLSELFDETLLKIYKYLIEYNVKESIINQLYS